MVLNDPENLAHALNKTYFQHFPEEVRPKTCISRNVDEIKQFIDEQHDKVVIKPLQGSGGKNVFLVGARRAGQPQPDDRRRDPRRLLHRPGVSAGRRRRATCGCS